MDGATVSPRLRQPLICTAAGSSKAPSTGTTGDAARRMDRV